MSRITSIGGRWIIALGFVIGVSNCLAPRVHAQDANTASVEELQKRVQDLEAVVQQMRDGRAPNSTPAMPMSLPPVVPTAPVEPTNAAVANANTEFVPAEANPPVAAAIKSSASGFSGWKDGFLMQSADKAFQLKFTGQLQSDFRGFLTPVDETTDSDTFLIRRARLGIEATMANYYEFRLLPDFAGSTPPKSIADAYMNVHYWDEFQFETGKFKQPFSYEQLIQDRYVPTMERSMMDQLVPQRDEGVMIHGHKMFGDRFEYQVAVSNGDQNDSVVDTNNHKDLNGRVAFRPFNCDDWDIARGLQFGISLGVGVENEVLSSTTNPATITTPATVTWFSYATGVSANGVRERVSPELAYFYHSLGFAAQYYHQDETYQLTAAKPLVAVPVEGYYVMATYLLTGEQRHEFSQQIDPLRPFCPCAPVACPGAWELVFRADRLEVGNEAFSPVAANRLAAAGSTNAAFETTVGVNWYMNSWARVQLNWENANFASPVKMGNVANAFTKEDCLYTRFQVIF